MTDQELFAKLAGEEQDPIGRIAVEIVTELEREVCHRDTAWHDIGLHEIVEYLIRAHVNARIAELTKALKDLMDAPVDGGVLTSDAIENARRVLRETQP